MISGLGRLLDCGDLWTADTSLDCAALVGSFVLRMRGGAFACDREQLSTRGKTGTHSRNKGPHEGGAVHNASFEDYFFGSGLNSITMPRSGAAPTFLAV